jgi:hypothetical protein
VFVHEPVDAESVWPCCATPEICGKAVFDGAGAVVGADVGAGAAAVTTAVGLEVPVEEPFLFTALTVTRIVLPTSVDPSGYVDAAAPLTGAQPFPELSQRSHS